MHWNTTSTKIRVSHYFLNWPLATSYISIVMCISRFIHWGKIKLSRCIKIMRGFYIKLSSLQPTVLFWRGDFAMSGGGSTACDNLLPDYLPLYELGAPAHHPRLHFSQLFRILDQTLTQLKLTKSIMYLPYLFTSYDVRYDLADP